MKFINDDIIEIIFRKILFCQIFSLPQCRDRRKYHRLAGRFFFSMEKSVIIRISDIPERNRCLIQNLLPVRHKQHVLVIPGIKSRQICLSNPRSRLDNSPQSTLCPAVFQRTKRFNLRSPRLKQKSYLCIFLFFHIVITIQIFGSRRSVPGFRIPF